MSVSKFMQRLVNDADLMRAYQDDAEATMRAYGVHGADVAASDDRFIMASDDRFIMVSDDRFIMVNDDRFIMVSDDRFIMVAE